MFLYTGKHSLQAMSLSRQVAILATGLLGGAYIAQNYKIPNMTPLVSYAFEQIPNIKEQGLRLLAQAQDYEKQYKLKQEEQKQEKKT